MRFFLAACENGREGEFMIEIRISFSSIMVVKIREIQIDNGG